MSQKNDRDGGVNDDRLRELSDRQNRTVDESLELARLHLIGATVEDSERALAILDPLIGKTTSARQLRKLAALIGQVYATKRKLAYARAWLKYVELDNNAARKVLADVCFELRLFEEAAQNYRELVRQYESATR